MLNKWLLDQEGALLWGEDLRQIQPGPAGIRGRDGGTASCPAQPLERSCLFIQVRTEWAGVCIRSSWINFPGRKLGINHNGVATYLV